MKKRLLLGLLAAFATVSSFAQAVNTKTGCFVITGENVCTNGTFADADFTGWTPVSAVAGTECSALFSYSADNQSISSISNLFSEGMYYKFSASSSEPYISFFISFLSRFFSCQVHGLTLPTYATRLLQKKVLAL